MGGQGVALFQNKNPGLTKIKIAPKQASEQKPTEESELDFAKQSEMIFLGNR